MIMKLCGPFPIGAMSVPVSYNEGSYDITLVWDGHIKMINNLCKTYGQLKQWIWLLWTLLSELKHLFEAWRMGFLFSWNPESGGVLPLDRCLELLLQGARQSSLFFFQNADTKVTMVLAKRHHAFFPGIHGQQGWNSLIRFIPKQNFLNPLAHFHWLGLTRKGIASDWKWEDGAPHPINLWVSITSRKLVYTLVFFLTGFVWSCWWPKRSVRIPKIMPIFFYQNRKFLV